MKGTPRTLIEALEHGLAFTLGGDSQFVNASAIEPFIRDFLSQRFGAAMLTASDAEVDLLDRTFRSILVPLANPSGTPEDLL